MVRTGPKVTKKTAHTGWLVRALAATALLLLAAPMASAEQASSDLRRAQSGYLDAGDEHTCAILADRSTRCWGRGLAGRLGYGSEDNVLSGGGGGPVDVGAGRTARAIVAGDFHTCAILDDGSARCWGFGANGRLGYGNSANVLSPATAPAIDLGAGRTATAITAGASHTCVILDTGAVRCWGNGVSGRLGYGDQRSIGDDETPAAVGTVDIGAGRTAVAISAGDFHTCVIRDDAQLVCWGFGSGGQLGYGGTSDIGDDETPGAAGPVNLGPRRVRAVSGGKGHTCAVLDDGSARCWGFGADGRLGYGGTASITSAVAATSINLGNGRTAVAIAAGEAHSCAILDTGAVRCWGFGGNGRLGTGATDSIGNDPGETPASVAPVDLGPGRMGRALTVGFSHTCALLDDATVRCWGFGGSGRLGYGDEDSVGDSPARSVLLAGPVPLGGAVAPTGADLSLGLSASAGSIPVGGAVSLTVSLVNRGPDATDGVTVGMPAPAGLVYRAATASQGAFAGPTGLWSVGALPPGGSAALTVSVTADSPGTRTVTAEVVSSAVLDPTSTPGNGAPEDDRAAVTLVVPAIAAPAPTIRRLPRKLGVKVVRVPKRGLAKRLVVTGALALPAGTPRLRCAGKVRVRALVGKRAVASSTVALRARRGTCVYARTLRPTKTGSAKVVRVSATFLGTALMRPRASKAVRVRIR
jgi:uncharacterized repeat protein (TIGR01451 family)